MTVTRRQMLGLGLLTTAAAASGAVNLAAYRNAIALAENRADPRRSQLFDGPFGPLEHAIEGDGPPVLMIHGSGGGFDHGLFFARPLLEAGFRIIAPSRFGYLRSPLPADPSPENQADALVALLDHLQIERIAVIGGSAGALSAVQMALRHPARCQALGAIVPIGYVPDRLVTPVSPAVEAITSAVLQSDLLFWLATVASPDLVIGQVLATDPALVAAAPPAERARILEMVARILPVSRRASGILQDTALSCANHKVAYGDIGVPTLAISCEDDRYHTADAARAIAQGVAGAELIVYPTGGHLYVDREQALFSNLIPFLRRHIS